MRRRGRRAWPRLACLGGLSRRSFSEDGSLGEDGRANSFLILILILILIPRLDTEIAPGCGFGAVPRVHVSRSQQRTVPMSHFELEGGEVAEMRGVVGGERVPTKILPPGVGCLLAPAGRLAQRAPALHPAARDVMPQGVDVPAAQRHHASATRLHGLKPEAKGPSGNAPPFGGAYSSFRRKARIPQIVNSTS